MSDTPSGSGGAAPRPASMVEPPGAAGPPDYDRRGTSRDEPVRPIAQLKHDDGTFAATSTRGRGRRTRSRLPTRHDDERGS